MAIIGGTSGMIIVVPVHGWQWQCTLVSFGMIIDGTRGDTSHMVIGVSVYGWTSQGELVV